MYILYFHTTCFVVSTFIYYLPCVISFVFFFIVSIAIYFNFFVCFMAALSVVLFLHLFIWHKNMTRFRLYYFFFFADCCRLKLFRLKNLCSAVGHRIDGCRILVSFHLILPKHFTSIVKKLVYITICLCFYCLFFFFLFLWRVAHQHINRIFGSMSDFHLNCSYFHSCLRFW